MDNSGSTTKRSAIAIGAILVIFMGGSVSFMIVEGWTFWRSFFFTLITVTTVGYGAEGLSQAGERVAVVLILGGIGTATYAFGVIMRVAVETQLAWRSRMQNRLGKLHDHYIICGFGRIGRTVCHRLEEADWPLVVIEGEPEAVAQAKADGHLTILGNATEDDVLISAGIERARGVVAAVNSDAANIVITLGAREMRPDIPIFARVDADGAARKIRRAGATHIVSPFRTGAIDIANAIIHPNLSAFLNSAENGHGSFELSEITVSKSAGSVGESIANTRSREGVRVVFVAIKRADGSTLIGPKEDAVLGADDVVIVAGTSDDVSKVCSLLGDQSRPSSKGERRNMTSWGPMSPLV